MPKLNLTARHAAQCIQLVKGDECNCELNELRTEIQVLKETLRRRKDLIMELRADVQKACDEKHALVERIEAFVRNLIDDKTVRAEIRIGGWSDEADGEGW